MAGDAGAPLPPWAVVLAFAAAAAATYVAILLLRPLLLRIALASPNARSSHTRPTPQGGGIAVVGVTLGMMLIGFGALGLQGRVEPAAVAALTVAALLLMAAGAADDIHGLAPVARLAVQIVAVATLLYTVPQEARVAPALPWWMERALLLVAVVWFVNLVNFMDGLDWMTVAEVVPVAAGLAIAGFLGALPPLGLLTAIALAGAMIGFAPFNRPMATLFLGDAGSVPIGLILAWLLLLLAAAGHLAAAVLLPLYYLADATVTLARRIARGERVWEAHRTHFYQRATENGLPVRAVVARVFAVNVGLVALATATIARPSTAMDAAMLAAGAALVGWLLARFASRSE